MPRPPRPAIPCLALALCAGPAPAQQRIEIMPAPAAAPADEVVRPGASKRLVRVFDFEERDTNPHDVPEHWFHAQDRPRAPRPGFPSWNLAHLRYASEGATAASGEGAVQLPTAGGSTSLILGDGVIPVFPSADYQISALVRTDKLTHARAALAARFLDASGAALANSEVRTPLTLSNDRWTPISVELVGGAPAAAYIQLELLLLQPQQQGAAPHAADDTALWPQDLSGAAWFDDVSIVQLPRIELTTASTTNITTQPAAPRLNLLVRDLTGESLTVHIDVLDLYARPADTLHRKIGAGFTQTDWSPRLPRLGWYRAVMTVTTDSGAPVGHSYVDFLWAPPEPARAAADAPLAPDRARLGLTFTRVPDAALPAIPAFARQLGAGSVSFPVWDEDLRPEQVAPRAEALRPIIDTLVSERRAVALSLARVPTLLAAALQVEPEDPWALLASDSAAWLPYITPMLERFGQRINHWHVGLPGDDRALWRTAPAADAALINAALSSLVPGPVVGVPTPLGASWPAGAPTPMLIQSITPEFTPQSLALALRSAAPWLQSTAGEITYTLQPLDAASYTLPSAATNAARHVVEFWAALSQPDGSLLPGAALTLQDPWTWVHQGRRAQLMPRPESAVWRTLADQLAGRRVVGTLPGEGFTCYILAPAPGVQRPGALVAWSDSDQPQSIAADLGRAPLRTIDLFGNADPVPASATTTDHNRPCTTIPLSDAPIFIEGVDVDLIRFTGALAIDPPVLESSNDQHERELVVFNPWSTGISGEVTFLEPGGFDTGQKNRTWRISPRSLRFSVAPGKTERLPFKVAFSPVEEVGPKDFVLAVQLAGEKNYGTIEVRRSVEVTVQNIAMDLSATTAGRDNEDLVVEAVISNRGQSPLTLQLTAFAEGAPRSKAVITGLTPANHASRRFTYPGAAARLKGQRIIIAAEDPETKVRVNKSVVVP